MSGAVPLDARPAGKALLDALKVRAPFQKLVVADLDRIGRDPVRTPYAIQQIEDAGVEIWAYAVDKALAKVKTARSHHTSRRSIIERELGEVQRKLDRLLEALADGDLPADEIKVRLGTEKARKDKLTAELAALDQLAKLTTLDPEQLKRDLLARVADVTGLLGRQTVQTRQMLRKLMAGKIEFEHVAAGAPGATASGAR